MKGIEYRRKRIGISQIELANKIGVSQANVSQWESGSALPRSDKLPALAKALNCKIDDLFDEIKTAAAAAERGEESGGKERGREK